MTLQSFSHRRASGRLALVLLVFCSVAMARDLDQDEALRLRQQGVILPLEQLLQQALDRYPGAKLLEIGRASCRERVL